MKPVRTVVVFDAADLHAESAFWAGMLDGHVEWVSFKKMLPRTNVSSGSPVLQE